MSDKILVQDYGQHVRLKIFLWVTPILLIFIVISLLFDSQQIRSGDLITAISTIIISLLWLGLLIYFAVRRFRARHQ